MPDIHSCIALIEQSAGLPLNTPAEIGDWGFQLCNMGGELISIEGIVDGFEPPIHPDPLDHSPWNSSTIWISLLHLISQG